MSTNPDRREFLQRVMLSGARMIAGAGALGGLLGSRHSGEDHPGARGSLGIVRPPGAGDEDHFLASCTRCTRCADACPAQCIKLFGPEAGALHGTPYIVPTDRGCTMCLECGPACPTDALVPLDQREEITMGVAVVDERLCVSLNGTGVCGACHTACPLRNRAISQDFRNAPVVDPEQCTGCGMCEELCIVHDLRAIRVVTKRVLKKVDGARGQEVGSA